MKATTRILRLAIAPLVIAVAIAVLVATNMSRIEAASEILSIGNATVDVEGSTSVPVILSDAPDGVSGLRIEIDLDDSTIAEFTDVTHQNYGIWDNTVSASHVTLQIVDMHELINPGDTDITLANLVLNGNNIGASEINISAAVIDTDLGQSMTPIIHPGAITVNNVIPTVDIGPDLTINEGQAISGTGSIADTATDTWLANVDYGDGSGNVRLVLNDNQFPLKHTYPDDGVYTVTVTVTDNHGASASDSTKVTVNNVTPRIQLPGDVSLQVGESFTGNGSFADPGADSWTANVDYGDGSGAQSLVLSGKNFDLAHQYGGQGVYVVSVTVVDDEGASDADSFTVSISSVCPVLSGNQSLDNDGDGMCEDMNGNGRIDFSDVVYFHRNFNRSSIQNNADSFDFNGNGRLDSQDIVTLFRMMRR